MDARILIVDDEPANVILLERVLAQGGYAKRESITDPREAAGAFLRLQPDLVLLDLMMPHLDGFGVMRQLAPLVPAGAFQPVLVLTADPSDETRRRALAEGATDFLTKPFDPVEVLLRVKNLLQTRFLHVGLQSLNRSLEDRVRERTRELEDAYEREKELNRRLTELDRMKDAFLTAVSHEIRTPLSVVLGGAETLRRNLHRLPADKAEELTGRLSASARKLERLLGTVLDVNRLRLGIVEPQREPTQLGPLVERIVAEAGIKDHPLQVDVDPVEASFDPAHFERILDNLLANAVRHTPAGTPVWVTVRAEADGVLLAVDDAGPGVPQELKERCSSASAKARSSSIRPASVSGSPWWRSSPRFTGAGRGSRTAPGGGGGVPGVASLRARERRGGVLSGTARAGSSSWTTRRPTSSFLERLLRGCAARRSRSPGALSR